MNIRRLKYLWFPVALCVLSGVLLLTAVPQVMGGPLLQATSTGILAEPILEANLRSGPGIEYDALGTITNGQQYAVLGQHEFFPWLLLEVPGLPQGRGWIYADLVTLTVPLSAVPYLSDAPLLSTPTPSSSPSPVAQATQPAAGTATPSVAATAAFTSGVSVEVVDEVNARFGPGIEYPMVGKLSPGERYEAVNRHSLYPWLLIRYPGAPNGLAWVFLEVVEVSGDIYTLPAISVEQVDWPTLTPTPPFVVTSVPPWATLLPTPQAPDAATTATVNMQALGDSVLAYLLEQGFAPEANSFGSVFVLNLTTGENFSLGRDIAYSGMSLVKIAIMVEFFRNLNQPPDTYEADLIANTMMCSANHTSNAMLSIIGGGDELVGAQQVTATLHRLGLGTSFVLAPFLLSPDDPPLQINFPSPQTEADQVRAEPDAYSQITPEDLGWLLGAVYQCAMTEDGPLIDTFPGQFTPSECRKMILTMSANRINVLSEAGVPLGTQVAHKHGWIDDTHGDAAIVFTPGGDFVISMAFHQPGWLPYEYSWPTMAEVTRRVYNAFNPTTPLAVIHDGVVDEVCRLDETTLLGDLTASFIPPFE